MRQKRHNNWIISKSLGETRKLAKVVLENISGLNLICLFGQLGAGKTTWVQFLAKELGIGKRVISPSFILQRQYQINNRKVKFRWLYHLDCFRLKSDKDLKAIDLGELLADDHNLVVIEWADRIKNILPDKRIDIKFSYHNLDQRKIVYDFRN